MVGEIASRHALSDETIDGVGERTGGVPLFVEEVTQLLLERNAQGGAQAIPPTLQQSLAARLDRLGEAREVAQIGAEGDFGEAFFRDASQAACMESMRCAVRGPTRIARPPVSSFTAMWHPGALKRRARNVSSKGFVQRVVDLLAAA